MGGRFKKAILCLAFGAVLVPIFGQNFNTINAITSATRKSTGLYLINVLPSKAYSDSATITFQFTTYDYYAKSEIRYGLAANALNTKIDVTSLANTKQVHTKTLKPLSPNTTYYCDIWTDVVPGHSNWTAKTPVFSFTTTGPSVPVPIVAITTPASGASVTPGNAVIINATATIATGSITKVDFYDNTTLIGTDATAPYTYTIANIAAGNHPLSIKAYSDQNGIGTSATVTVLAVDPGSSFMSATFTTDTEGFMYLDDAFRSTSNVTYASGQYLGAGGRTGGGLQVLVGGIDDLSIPNMSGGWQKSATLASAGSLTITFDYNLTNFSGVDVGEYTEVLLAVDNILKGTGNNDYIVRLESGGTTGWQTFTTTVTGVSAGTHSVVFGAFMNGKTFNTEIGTLLIDNVSIVGSGSTAVHSKSVQLNLERARIIGVEKSSIRINLLQTGMKSAKIFSSSGAIIAASAKNPSSCIAQSVRPGVYFVHLQGTNTKIIERVVVR